MDHKSSDNKEIFLETLPEYLSAARQDFSYTTRQVAKVTGISEKFIVALERGYYYKLPADVYIKGFLRKLAELYRVDPDVLIFQYEKERKLAGFKKASGPSGKAQNPERTAALAKFVITPKSMTIAIVALFVILVVGYLSYQVHAINRPPIIIVDEPGDQSVVRSSSVLVSGKTEIGVNLSINDQSVDIDSAGHFKKLISMAPGKKILHFTAKNSFGKVSTKQISITADYQTQQEKEKPQQFTLVIKAEPGPAFIKVKIDDLRAIEHNFEPGDTQTYTANRKILISTDNAGSTIVSLNGKELGKLGREGERLENLPFSIDSLSKR